MWGRSWRVPQGLAGDFTLTSLIVKGMTDHGWFLTNNSLGWPLGNQLFDLPLGSNNLNNLLMRVIALFTSDFAVVINVFVMLTFPMVAVAAFLVARRLGISRAPATLVGVLYTFIQYHFRGQVMLFLIGYWAMPFAILLAIRIFQGERIFARRPGFKGWRSWLSRRNVATVATCLAIGSTVFYLAAFAMVLIAAAAASRLLAKSSRRVGLMGVAAFVLIGGFVVANDAPALVHRQLHGTNEAVGHPGEFESEIYGLTLTRLIIPPSNHRFGPARRFGAHYELTTALKQAGEQSSYVGIVSVAGGAGLLAFALVGLSRGHSEERLKRYGPLAACVGVAFLWGTIGGANSIFSYTVLPLLRGLGRMSTVIAFCCLLAVAYALDGMRRRLGRHLWAFPAIVTIIAIVGLYDQTANAFTKAYRDATQAEWNRDARFVRNIEAAVPGGTAIYTLPEQPFPDGPLGGMLDYDSAQGYLHSKTLRWSYGAVRGREGDWLVPMSGLGLPAKLVKVRECGFGGVWLDRAGYTNADDVQSLLARLTRTKPIVSEDGRRVFFSLQTFNNQTAGQLPETIRRERCQETTHPIEPEPGPGFGIAETDGVTNWRRLAADTRFGLRNDLDSPRRSRVTFTLRSTSTRPTPIKITGPDGASVEADLDQSPKVVTLMTTLPPGTGAIHIEARVPTAAFPDPSHALFLDALGLGDIE